MEIDLEKNFAQIFYFKNDFRKYSVILLNYNKTGEFMNLMDIKNTLVDIEKRYQNIRRSL